jgi:hypothetical protein
MLITRVACVWQVPEKYLQLLSVLIAEKEERLKGSLLPVMTHADYVSVVERSFKSDDVAWDELPLS